MHAVRVLVIDDSLTIRALVEELLTRHGRYTAIAMAPDVETARLRIADFRPTIITLDLNMPRINGLALLRELQDYPHAPVVVLSSATTDGSSASEEAVALGAFACFDKSRIVAEARRFVRLLDKAVARGAGRTSLARGSLRPIAA